MGDIPEEYSGEENDEAEEDFVPGGNWDIVELNMLPYELISTSIPPELASLLLFKNTMQSTMLNTTSRLAIVVEMSGEPHYAHRRNAQQVEILPCTVSVGRPTFVMDWFFLHSHTATISGTGARHEETNKISAFSLTNVELGRWTQCKNSNASWTLESSSASLSPTGPVRGGGRREG